MFMKFYERIHWNVYKAVLIFLNMWADKSIEKSQVRIAYQRVMSSFLSLSSFHFQISSAYSKTELIRQWR